MIDEKAFDALCQKTNASHSARAIYKGLVEIYEAAKAEQMDEDNANNSTKIPNNGKGDTREPDVVESIKLAIAECRTKGLVKYGKLIRCTFEERDLEKAAIAALQAMPEAAPVMDMVSLHDCINEVIAHGYNPATAKHISRIVLKTAKVEFAE